MALDNFDDIKTDEAAVKAVADQFVKHMRDGHEEGQMIGADYMNAFVYEPKVCASHDYCDANMDMQSAMVQALVDAGVSRDRAYAFASCCDDDATEAAQERRNGLWNAAWAQAKEGGFSYAKAQMSLEDFRTLAPCLLMEPTRSAKYPTAPETVISECDHGSQDLTDAIERDEVPGERLAAIAAAVRAGDDDALAGLLEGIVREEELTAARAPAGP